MALVASIGAAISLCGVVPAMASVPELLLRMPETKVFPGPGAGELDNPRSLAGDPANGHVFVADRRNARVDEYTAWGLFVKAWGWGVLDGAAKLQVCGPSAPDPVPPATLCRAGVKGSGKGQLQLLEGGIAVDGSGAVWVGDLENHRIQKFSAAGDFLLMIGGEVDKTTKANVCTAASGDECGEGSAGEGPGQFKASTVGDFISYSPAANAIYVGDKGRIQAFNTDGTFKGEIPFAGELAAFAGESVSGLDVGPGGNLFIALAGKPDIHKLSPAGALLEPKPACAVKNPLAVAVDGAGNVYAAEKGILARGVYVLGCNAAGEEIVGMEANDEFAAPEVEAFPQFAVATLREDIVGLAINSCAGSEGPDLYAVRANLEGPSSRAYVSVYGAPPIGCEAPPKRPPDIKAQYAVRVDDDAAVLKAQINPRFWNDTTYYLQYGTAPCSEGGCKEAPAPPGAKLTAKVVGAPVTSAGIVVGSLVPGTTYHYRFVAQSSGSEGVPVFGRGGTPAAEGEEGTFTTFRTPTTKSCPGNEAFRVGPAKALPDCRAYELVSPLDKNNGDILVGFNLGGFPTGLYQSSADGQRLTYSALRSFGDPEAAPYTSQYLAERSADPQAGWQSEAISPPRTQAALALGDLPQGEFKAFSSDLCTAWLRHDADPPLSPDAVAGFPNVYRRENCGAQKGSYAALTTTAPQHGGLTAELEFQGASADGSEGLFVANDNLSPEAPNNKDGRFQLYVSSGGQLRFACILPSGKASVLACTAGSRDVGTPIDRGTSAEHAISADGSRVYWSESASGSGPGTIYLREGPGFEQSAVEAGKCTEAPAKACTFAVSGSVSAEPAWFWGASADGSRALFSLDPDGSGPSHTDLYEFDADAKAAQLIAHDSMGVAGISADGSHVYLVSGEVLSGLANSEGEKAEAGNPNLYLYQPGGGGSFAFVAPLAEADVSQSSPSPVSKSPVFRTSRVSADGASLAYTSSLSPTPTGYDNLDGASNQADTEVYLYSAGSGKLICASCNPSGARPSGRSAGLGNLWVAARIPAWELNLHASRVLSADGRRLFFESYDPLALRDTNGVKDVYQWEADGTGSCEAGDASFSAKSGGCVELISSGESPRDSEFLDADESGKDVFFTTLSSLVAQDYGLVDVYDARAGGGLPGPGVGEPQCEGEACQSPPPPPVPPVPASSAYRGKPNPALRAHCRKGTHRVTHRGKSRCARNHRRRHRRRGRAGR